MLKRILQLTVLSAYYWVLLTYCIQRFRQLAYTGEVAQFSKLRKALPWCTLIAVGLVPTGQNLPVSQLVGTIWWSACYGVAVVATLLLLHNHESCELPEIAGTTLLLVTIGVLLVLLP